MDPMVVLQITVGVLVAFLVPALIGTFKIYRRLNEMASAADARKIHDLVADEGFRKMVKFFLKSDTEGFLEGFLELRELRTLLLDYRKSSDVISNIFRTTFANEPIARIHAHIEANDKLRSRFSINAESKNFLMDHFTHIDLVQRILRDEDSIFIESGSTLAFLIIPMMANLPKIRPRYKTHPLRICTNNIIIYIYLLFQEHVNPQLLPGKSTNSYGATFGDPHNPNSCDAAAVTRFLTENEVTALFTTCSELDVTYGPHVSSEANHDIKNVWDKYAKNGDHQHALVVCAEKINNNVADEKLREECRLIFHHENGGRVDSRTDLAKIKAQWGVFLRRHRNYIITGAADPNAARAATDMFRDEYNDLKVLEHPREHGQLAVFEGTPSTVTTP